MPVKFTDAMCDFLRCLSRRAADLEVFVSMALRANEFSLEQAVHLARRVRGVETDAACLAQMIERGVEAASREEKPLCSPA